MFLTPQAHEERAPDDDFWYQSLGTSTASGARVSEESAMRTSAVYACVRVLSESVAQLPLHVYERTTGGKERAETHALSALLSRQPNSRQTSFEFREMMQGHLSLRGNAYALKDMNGAGRIRSLEPIHPDYVKPELKSNGTIVYKVKEHETSARAGSETIYTQSQIMHLRGLSSDGYVGLSPVQQARESIGMAISAEEFGARFFQNDAKSGVIIEHPTHFKDENALSRFKRQFTSARTGANRHKTVVLEDGMTAKEIGLTNKDSQFIEARKFQVSDIARIFRIPPHLIGDLDKATFGNIEHQGLEFVIHTIGPWLVRWEQAISRDLIRDPDKYFVEHLVDALLRGDIQSRYTAYGVGITNGFLTRNEVRKKENMNPIDGLDDPLTPMNMAKESERIAKFEESELRAAFNANKIGAFHKRAREIYSVLSKEIQETLGLSDTAAMTYCEVGRSILKDSSDIEATLDGWAEKRGADLENFLRLYE